MISWIIIIAIVLIAVFALKMNRFRHKFFIVLVLLFALFIYISMAYVANKNNLDMNSFDGVMKSVKVYGGWLSNNFGNIRALTGNAVKMDWTSTNSSFFNKKNDSSLENTKVPDQASVKFVKK